jgi:hypothetical protein
VANTNLAVPINTNFSSKVVTVTNLTNDIQPKTTSQFARSVILTRYVVSAGPFGGFASAHVGNVPTMQLFVFPLSNVNAVPVPITQAKQMSLVNVTTLTGVVPEWLCGAISVDSSIACIAIEFVFPGTGTTAATTIPITIKANGELSAESSYNF